VPLRHAADLAAADWVTGWSFEELVTFGRAGFEAYARLRFIPDPTRPGQDEADVQLPDDHPSDLDQARRALDHLGRHTATPDRCYFCIWDGYGSFPASASRGDPPLLHLPHRSYALMEGPLDALRTWEAAWPTSPLVPPALVWPADHRWCFVKDVDPHWAGIGASREAVAELLDDEALDVVTADPRQPQPYYYQ
jgi:hypothetical protein